MRERKLDEVFEESLTAYLDEGRSVEDSLRLYPEFRGELEPLLRTALAVSVGFQSYSPPAAVQERGLARFLSDARGRAHLNGMRRESRRGWFAGLFGAPKPMGLAAAGVAVAVLAIAVGIATMGGGGESDKVANGPTPSRASVQEQQDDETSVPALVLQDTIEAIRKRLSQSETIDPAEVEALTDAVRQLKNDESNSPEEVEAVITDLGLDDTLVDLVSVQPELAPQVEETREVAGIGGGSLPTPILDPDPTTAAGPVDPPPPTVEPTPPPTAAPTPVPTPVPTEVSTPAPTPTSDARVPGFIPIN
jgi:hypothetical protein